MFPSLDLATGRGRGRNKIFVGNWGWYLVVVWLASATAAAQEGGPQGRNAGAEAARPAAGVTQSPDDAAATAAAAKEDEREARDAQERTALRAEVEGLRAQ